MGNRKDWTKQKRSVKEARWKKRTHSEDIQQTHVGKRVFFDVEGVDLSVPLPQELLELVDQTDDYDDEDEDAT